MSAAGEQARQFAESAPGLALQLRDAARALGYATLALRANQPEAAATLIRHALRSITVAEAGLPIGGADR